MDNIAEDIGICNRAVIEEICEISIKEELSYDAETVNETLIKEEISSDTENIEYSIKQEPSYNDEINDPVTIQEFKFDSYVNEGVKEYENYFMEKVYGDKKSVFVVKEEPEVNIKIETDPLDYHHYPEYVKIKEQENKRTDLEKTTNLWICYPCNKSFNSNQCLKKHSERCHNTCAKCGKIFQSKSEHYKISHKRFECKHCELSFSYKKLHAAHLKESHTSYKLHWSRCRVCKEILKSKKSRISHEEKEHGHLKQTCEMCNEVCLNMHFLSKHTANKHCTVNNNGKFECCYCKKEHSSRTLIYHIMNKHFNQHSHPCNQCDKGFNSKRVLEEHVQAAHNDVRNYHCKNCTKTFKILKCLQIHNRNVHEESKNIECNECGKIFRNKHYLNSHQNAVHRSKIKIICDDCGNSFSSKDAYKLHYISKHSDVTDQAKHTHKCPYPNCDYSTLQKYDVKKHVKRVHIKEKGKHLCSLCPKIFHTKSSLEEHINGVHLNIKPFKCDNCEFASAYKSTLNEHKKVTHGTQRYDCPHCDHFARYKGNLDKHINNVHKKVPTNSKEINLL